MSNNTKLEIMIKGAELSSKLNSIGIVNEFGRKSEGKQDLTDIIDLVINKLDYIIWFMKQPLSLSLTPSSEYVYEDEVFSLNGVLTNNADEGFSGESVTITGDDGSSFTSETDSDGIYSVNGLSVDNNTTYTSVYNDLTSIVKVYLAFLKDTFNHEELSDDWTNSGIESVTYDSTEECLVFENTVSTGYLLSTSDKCFKGDFVISFKIKTTLGYNTQLSIRSLTNTNLINKRGSACGLTNDTWHNIRIVRTSDNIKFYCDDVEKTSDTISTEDCLFRFYNDIPNTFMIKDFVAYKK